MDILRNRIRSIITSDSLSDDVKIEKLLVLIYEERLKEIIKLKEKIAESEVQQNG